MIIASFMLAEYVPIIAINYVGLELFLPAADSSPSYRVAAVYYTDTSDAIIRSKLIRIRQNDIPVIIFHHYNIEKVLHIFEMVQNHHKLLY